MTTETSRQFSPLNTAKQRLINVQQRITSACQQTQRQTSEIQLVGASKTKAAQAIREMFHLGQTHFGENYLNEAINKQSELTDLDITWHYIGQIQSNKTKLLAQHFDWIHGVDRLKIAQRLSEQNQTPKPINVLIQVNLDQEDSKAGVHLNDIKKLAEEIAGLPNLTLRGLMALPKPRESFTEQYDCLVQLKNSLNDINHSLNLNLDTISAGMSNDLEAAIASGSTMVRIGTDLFGART